MTYSASTEGMFESEKPEGKTTRGIEKRTSRIPSGVYLAAAIGSMIASAGLMIAERGRSSRFMSRGGGGLANFVGQWAPTLLIIGLYNKVVKLEDELVGLR